MGCVCRDTGGWLKPVFMAWCLWNSVWEAWDTITVAWAHAVLA